MVGPKILAFRTKNGITQKQLADLAATSEQHIHRIETGRQSVCFDLAVKICSALNEPMESVFPGTEEPLEKLGKKCGESLMNLSESECGEEMSCAAVDMGPFEWTFKYRLRGGATGSLSISGTEKDHLFSAVQRDEIGSFVVFDSEGSTIVLNMDHLIFCHFRSDPPNRMHPERERINEVKVFIVDSSAPFHFEVEADEHDEGDPEPFGQFEELVFTAEHASSEANVVFYFKDVDGEEAFFRASDIAMIQIPLWVFEADLLEVAYEQAGESSPTGGATMFGKATDRHVISPAEVTSHPPANRSRQ